MYIQILYIVEFIWDVIIETLKFQMADVEIALSK
jgi:hypothetical protein